MNKRLLNAGIAALAATAPVLAEVKINDYFSVAGYAAVSATRTEVDGPGDFETFADSGANNLDAAKVSLNGKYEQLSGSVGLLYIPEFVDEAGIIEAYATYTAGSVSFTGGKFLSYLGYEAFNIPDMNQLTYGSTISAIPAYHTGVRVDYATDTIGLGLAVVDSIYPEKGLFSGGDGKFNDELGFEAVFTYKGIDKLTVFNGIAFEDTDGGDEIFVYNLWLGYAATDSLTLGAEYVFSKDASNSFLGFAQFAFSEKFLLAGRISTIQFEDGVGNDNVMLTVAPTYKFTDYFLVRAEVSYTDFDVGGEALFYGTQAVFKF